MAVFCLQNLICVLVIFADQVFIDPTFCGIFVCGPFQSFVVNVHPLSILGLQICLTDPICCKFCMVVFMVLKLVLANPIRFLCDTST